MTTGGESEDPPAAPPGSPPPGWLPSGPPLLPDASGLRPATPSGGSPADADLELQLELQQRSPRRGRAGWSGWEVLIVAVAGLLVGLLIGVITGVWIHRSRTDAHASAAPGSSEQPIDVGEAQPIGGGWTVRVVKADADAGAQIATMRDANEPPGPNESYLLITLEMNLDASLAPTASSSNPQTVLMWLLDANGTKYLAYQHSCGYFPNPIFEHGLLDPGGAMTANQCWAVPTDTLDGMRLLVSSPGSSAPQHFAIH
jgi:hypothetical protein